MMISEPDSISATVYVGSSCDHAGDAIAVIASNIAVADTEPFKRPSLPKAPLPISRPHSIDNSLSMRLRRQPFLIS